MHNLALHDPVRSQEREITLLFTDLRGFTELAASLEMDPLVCELLAHVMDCLTDAVMDHHGLVVDYYGDGLVAMWNAPADQPDHAELACRAALEMLQNLPAVTDDWIGVIQTDLRLGIGLHTGMAQVGNAGSTRQIKYGPRGPNVHLASRVEAATKELGLPLIATQSTAQRLSSHFATDRVCRAELPGLRQPVDLYAVSTSPRAAHVAAAWQVYDEALRQFERGQVQVAQNTLTSIDAAVAQVPSRFLAEQVERELGRQLSRRTTDRPTGRTAGVIALSAK